MPTPIQAIAAVVVGVALALGIAAVADSAPAGGCTGTETDHGSIACDALCNAQGNCNRP